MSGDPQALEAHLAGGLSTVCRCWVIRRRDGVVQGFTDHDRPLVLDGITCAAEAGLSAASLQQSTGLSVDNSEVVGALSDAGLGAQALSAGRYDGAEIEIWLVNWADVDARKLIFRGNLGEVEQTGQAFQAELRGLAERLNRPQGRVFRKECSAVLGDGGCRVNLSDPRFGVRTELAAPSEGRLLRLPVLANYDLRWFERGRLEVLSGEAAGLGGTIKNDRWEEEGRVIELWESIDLPLAPGDGIRLLAGCDKRLETCRLKFGNLLNFQGFPFIPGEDWLMSYPSSGQRNDGGSRGR